MAFSSSLLNFLAALLLATAALSAPLPANYARYGTAWDSSIADDAVAEDSPHHDHGYWYDGQIMHVSDPGSSKTGAFDDDLESIAHYTRGGWHTLPQPDAGNNAGGSEPADWDAPESGREWSYPSYYASHTATGGNALAADDDAQSALASIARYMLGGWHTAPLTGARSGGDGNALADWGTPAGGDEWGQPPYYAGHAITDDDEPSAADRARAERDHARAARWHVPVRTAPEGWAAPHGEIEREYQTYYVDEVAGDAPIVDERETAAVRYGSPAWVHPPHDDTHTEDGYADAELSGSDYGWVPEAHWQPGYYAGHQVAAGEAEDNAVEDTDVETAAHYGTPHWGVLGEAEDSADEDEGSAQDGSGTEDHHRYYGYGYGYHHDY